LLDNFGEVEAVAAIGAGLGGGHGVAIQGAWYRTLVGIIDDYL
jgi:hypothetical protein